MSEYVDFHYMPLEGKITGKQVLKQTEDAINDLGEKVYSIDIDSDLIQQAIDDSQTALDTAEEALSVVTTDRAIWYNNVGELIQSNAEAGVTIATKGYYIPNDGGNGFYIVRNKQSADVDDGGSIIVLNNGNVAELITDGSIDIAQFGAVGDGATDDTDKIQACLDYCGANNVLCTAKLGKEYYVGGTISTITEMDFSSATFVTNATDTTIVLQIGNSSTQGSGAVQHTYKLPAVVNDGHSLGDGWTGYENSVGVRVVNMFTSSFYLGVIDGFGVGLHVVGDTKGVSYNTFYGDVIRDNKINLYCDGENSGWCTANTFNINRIRQDLREQNNGVPYEGTKNIYINNASDNIFMHPCIEGRTEATEYSLDMMNAKYNLFVCPRLEASSGQNVMPIRYDATSGDACCGNTIFGAYAITNFAITNGASGGSTSPNEILASRLGARYRQTNPLVFCNQAGGSQPNLMGFSPNASADVLSVNATSSTKWSWQIAATGLSGKNYTYVSKPQIFLDFAKGRAYFGQGNADPTNYIGAIRNNALSDTGIFINCDLYPETTQASSLGASTNEWKDIYLLNAPTVSSDRNAKQQIRELSEREKAVALMCKTLIRAYKLNSEVEQKGEKAKTHIGAIAQDVVEAFDVEGLNALNYGIVEQDENGKYSIRYAELLAFIIGAL